MNVKNRFIKYAKIHTTSDPTSNTSPSSTIQWDLAKILTKECQDIGLSDVTCSDFGVVTATLPRTVKGVPTVGLIAHMDTSPDFSGEHVNPISIPNYDGAEILLNEKLNLYLSPLDFPELKNHIGKELLVTDGTTLLGADDKAGIAEILTAMEYFISHPEIPHGTIRIAFTPDEEIGSGTDHFDIEAFGADFAYTIDGGPIGEIQYQNFNAASAKITVFGKNIHPGSAKNKMKNAILVGMELQQLLPVEQRPEYTEGFEGFFHLNEMEGNVERCELEYIIRDHNLELFQEKKETLRKVVNFLSDKYAIEIDLEIRDSYYNMEEKIKPVFDIITLVVDSMKKLDIVPIQEPIRGGTDGAMLSFRGLPCPNIFTGGMNFHGKYEYIPVEDMEKAVELLIEIIKEIPNRFKDGFSK